MFTIRSLTAGEFDKFERHLKRLERPDRILRFAHAAGDADLERIVAGIRPGEDGVIGCFGPDLEVVGAVQISATHDHEGNKVAEFAFSVETPYRNRRIGTRLFERAAFWARNRGIRRAYVFCLAENVPMVRLARRFHMALEAEGNEVTGTLALDGPTPVSVGSEILAENLAMMDYQAAAQLNALEAWWRLPLDLGGDAGEARSPLAATDQRAA